MQKQNTIEDQENKKVLKGKKKLLWCLICVVCIWDEVGHCNRCAKYEFNN